MESYKSLFEKYQDSRLLQKYVDYSKWTIPKLFPQVGKRLETRGNDTVERDFQSMGGILVNSLASSLLQMLFPIGLSFFRIKPTKDLENLLKSLNKEKKIGTVIDLENIACEKLLSNAGYANLGLALAQLIVTGNVLLFRRNEGIVCYNTNQYSMLRDNDGTVLDIIVRESIAYSRLPEDIKYNTRLQGKKDFDPIDMYTRIKRVVREGTVLYEVSTEVEDIPYGETELYHEHLCPYIPVVWSSVNGNSYGHGLVEDYAGDFAKLSMLNEALALYELDACKVVNLCKPGSGSDFDALESAQTGDWVLADPVSVSKLEGGNYQLISAIGADIASIWERLSVAFMYSANVRDAERVTAEEIKLKIRETDKTLGGVYSQLSKSLHIPLAYLLITEVLPELIPYIIKGTISLEIQTGTAALGRTSDVERLMRAFEVITVLVPAAQQSSARFNTERIIDLVLTSNNIKLEDVMYTEEELEEKKAQEQQAQSQMLNTMGLPGGTNPVDLSTQLGGM